MYVIRVYTGLIRGLYRVYTGLMYGVGLEIRVDNLQNWPYGTLWDDGKENANLRVEGRSTFTP